MPLQVRRGTPIVPRMKALADRLLPVPYFKQEQTNWCWAGCSEMIYHLYGITSIRQCDMAAAQFGANCCANPGSSVCNQPNWPENTLNRVGIRSIRINGSYNAFSLQAEVDAGRPLMTYYAWTGGGAHVAVVRGYYGNGDLDVHDPAYGPGRRTYSNVLAGYGYGTWAMTYHSIRR
jgi:hypothetical protein